MNRIDFLFLKCQEKIGGMKNINMLDVGNLDNRGYIHSKIIDRFKNINMYGLDVVDQKSIGTNFSNQKIGSFEDINYPDNFFDIVYIGEVLEHTWKPKQVVDNCFKILKKGGIMIIDTPNVYSFSRILRYLFRGKDII